MNQRIIYPTDDGGVAVVVPVAVNPESGVGRQGDFGIASGGVIALCLRNHKKGAISYHDMGTGLHQSLRESLRTQACQKHPEVTHGVIC